MPIKTWRWMGRSELFEYRISLTRDVDLIQFFFLIIIIKLCSLYKKKYKGRYVDATTTTMSVTSFLCIFTRFLLTYTRIFLHIVK